MDSKSVILIVEDNDTQREGLSELLVQSGEFEVLQAADGEAALKIIGQTVIDLIILDVDLGGGIDGYALSRAARRQLNDVQIVMLSGMATERHKVKGLDSGADDFVVKPVGFDELAARIRAKLRRRLGSYPVGRFTLDSASKELVNKKGGKERLTETEFRLMVALIRAGGETAKSEDLMRKVWNYRPDLNTHTLQTHVGNLRRKIERDPSNPETLLTEKGGYRLVV